MGQINLFATQLTDNVQEFLGQFRQGALRPIAGIRILEDETRLRCHLSMATLSFSYVIVEIVDPITNTDVDWLYRGIIAEEHDMEKSKIFRYAVERALTPPGATKKRSRMDGAGDYEKAKRFRQCLELPAMALRHYNNTYNPDGDVRVERHGQNGSILVIEYEERPLEKKGND